MEKHKIIPVGRAKDITRERFGRLVVIGRVENVGNRAFWLCKCDCGNYKEVSTSSLRVGDTVSCGCKRAELTTPHDISNQRFGRLVAMELTDKRSPSGDAYWECKCDCGNITLVKKSRLSGGYTQSCGCLARESTSKRQSKSGLDLTNKTFGRLKVLRPTGEKNSEGRIWFCECECGGTIETSARSLNGGRTKSCGCLQVDKVTQLGLSNKGINNPAYNHELTEEQRNTNIFHRTSSKAKEVRLGIYRRDGFKCTLCGDTSARLVAHHIESFADNKDKRFNFSNLVTLCEECHKEFHKTYGYGNNTKEQFEEFKNKIIT